MEARPPEQRESRWARELGTVFILLYTVERLKNELVFLL